MYDNKMSFTKYVKEDIVRLKGEEEVQYSKVRKRAMLSAFLRLNGVLSTNKQKERLLLRTENAKTARFFYNLINEFYEVEISFSYQKNMRFKKRTYYIIVIESKVDEILTDLGVSLLGGAIDRKIVYSDDTAAGYAAGAFLARGSVNSPQSSNYHLEISIADELLADKLRKLIAKFKHANFEPKVILRRDRYIVYLKKSNQIGEFLIFIGATAAALEFEKVRIDRDVQHAAQRISLCDEANYNKTLKSAEQQIADIELLEQKHGLNHFDNPKLKPLCELRLENEDMSMAELAEALSAEMNLETPVSKSNIAHLFRKLHVLAESYRKAEKL